MSGVHSARGRGGSWVHPSPARTVTCGGSPPVTTPAGGTAKSDSIPFAVQALSDVAISFYLPQQTANATGHQLGEQTNYISPGDVAGNATLASPQTTGSYYFLANLDVQNPAAEGAVVTLAASITDGIASAADANRPEPTDLADRRNPPGPPPGPLNQGITRTPLLSDS